MKRIFFFAFVLCGTSIAWAQQKPGDKGHQRPQSRYVLGEKDEVLLPVNVLGLVNKPGQYMVPFGTDLISLIAFAGGFTEEAKINKVKIVHSSAVNGNNSKSYGQVKEIDIKRFFDTGEQHTFPQLMPDDTILVSGSATVKIFDFLSKVAVLAQIYFFIRAAGR